MLVCTPTHPPTHPPTHTHTPPSYARLGARASLQASGHKRRHTNKSIIVIGVLCFPAAVCYCVIGLLYCVCDVEHSSSWLQIKHLLCISSDACVAMLHMLMLHTHTPTRHACRARQMHIHIYSTRKFKSVVRGRGRAEVSSKVDKMGMMGASIFI